MEVALNVSLWRARFGLCAAIAVVTAMYLALPGQALAVNGATGATTCIGHDFRVHSDDPEEHPVEYVFACPDKITGYSLIANQDMQSFDTDTLVYNDTGLIPDEKFACEGPIPGNVFSCNGIYGGLYHVVKGTFGVAEPACHEPRVDLQLLVYYAKNTSGADGAQAIAGPFELGRPREK